MTEISPARELPPAAVRPDFDKVAAELAAHTVAGLKSKTSDEWGGPPLIELARFVNRPVDLDAVARDAASRNITPLALASAAQDLGLDLIELHEQLSSLEASDFPCLLMLKNGYAVALSGKSGPRTYTVLTARGVIEAPVKDLVRESGGTLFRVLRVNERAAASEEASPPRVGSLLGEACRYTFRNHPGLVVQLLVCALVGNVLLLAMPVFSMAVYDRVLPHFAVDTMWALTIGIGIALVADISLRFVRIKLSDALAASATAYLQGRFFQKLLHIKPDIAPRRVGTLTTTLRELEKVSHLLPMALTAIIIDLPFTVLVIAALAMISNVIAIITLVASVVLMLLYVVSNMLAERKEKPAQELARGQTNLMIEAVDALSTVKSLGLEQRLLTRWERHIDEMAFATHNARLWHTFTSQASLVLSQVVVVIVMIAAVHEIAGGLMTLGALSAAVLLVNRIMMPLGQVATSIYRLIQSGDALEPAKRILSAPDERGTDGSFAADQVKEARLSFTNVSFSPEGTTRPVLNRIEFAIEPGERVAIIGMVGAGKSSILKLMTRLYEPGTGVVRLDGIDVRQRSPNALRRTIGLMAQDSVLFDDTLYANLTMAQPEADRVAFDNAARVSGLQDIIATKRDGYSTRVGPRGEFLSGGERQAASLARTLLSDPKILLLDEPTANMDTGSEHKVVHGLKGWLGNRTLIVATHRLSVLDLVDRVIWLDRGRIIADGPKAEVMSRIANAEKRAVN